MNKLVDDIAADVRRYWLTVLQTVNAAAVAIAGTVIAAQEVYPDVAKQLLSGLPPRDQAIALILFGGMVHLIARQAKKAA